MIYRKAVFGIMAFLACTAVILWFVTANEERKCGEQSLELVNHTYDVSRKYESLFERQPNLRHIWRAYLRDERTGHRTDTWGIVIIVEEKVDQDTLLPEDRIPDELEEVPVQIISKEIVDILGRWYREGLGASHFDYMDNVLEKYWHIFEEYPYDGARIGFPERGSEPGYEIWGIEVLLAPPLDLSTLPPEDRLPDCLDDLPVKILQPKRPIYP